MKLSKAGLLGIMNGTKGLAAVVVVVALVITSAAAAITLSDMGASDLAGGSGPTIIQMDSDVDEAYVDEPVVWNVTVYSQIHGENEGGLLFTWDWDDGNYTVVFTEYSVKNSIVTDVETHAWTLPGTYDVKVSVWDGYKSEQSLTHNVSATTPFTVFATEVNMPPTADFRVSPEEGTVDTVFTFDASSSSDSEDPVGLLLVRWDWESDGVWDSDYTDVKTAVHRFTTPGTYSVLLEVTDTGDLTAQTSIDVTVSRSAELTPHDPIVIDGDTDFVYENGVIGGTGAADDPYVISGWIIEAHEVNAIDVRNAHSCFVISDCVLTGDMYFFGAGVYLDEDWCATIERVNISGFYFGVRATDMGELGVDSCQVEWNANGVSVFIAESVDVSFNTVSNNCVGDGNGEGVSVANAGYVSAFGNTMEGNRNSAVRVFECGFASIMNNTAAGMIEVLYTPSVVAFNTVESDGIFVYGCTGTMVMANVIGTEGLPQSMFGIQFTSCTDLTITNNTVYSFYYGIGTHLSAQPPADSQDVVIERNWISGSAGSGLRIYYISNLLIAGNVVTGCTLGMDVTSTASYVAVYHNDIVDNDVQVVESSYCVGNVWDDGYPSGGNYWSDYLGADEYGGVDQTEPWSDGIGDTPYVLTSGSQDGYPLMYPFSYWNDNTAPEANFTVSPPMGTVDTVFLFDASTSSDLEDDPSELMVRWDWESDGIWDTGYSTEKTASHQFALTGYCTVALEVMDSSGLTDTAYECVTVLDTGVLTPHDPIYISGDAHFAVVASEEGWAGDGTEADPYIIEFLDLSSSYASMLIYVTDTTAHFVIRDCLLSGASSSAIYMVNVANVTVQSSLFLSCPSVSIYCEQCTDVTILNNDVVGGARCMSLIRCTDAYLGNNTVEGAEWYPLCIESSHDVTLRENRFNGAGIKLGGYLVSHWNSHDIDDSNSVNDGPVYYIEDRVGGSVPSEAGQLIIVNCTEMTVQCIATGGITLGFSPGCLVTGSAVSSVHWGVYIQDSPGTTVWSTSAYGCDYGIFLLNSESSTIVDSAVYSCDYGMYIQQSNGFSALNNTVTDSYSYGIQVFATWYGEIRYNLIARGLQTGLDLAESNYILVASNDVSDNFIQASEGLGLTGNLWDCGYPTGGNYWSDYQGVDEYSGVDQTEPGPDGIGDTPYIFGSGSQDNYPLMEPLFPEPGNAAPVASFTAYPYEGTTETIFEFDASASWDLEDQSDLLLRWDWESDGIWDTVYTIERTAYHQFEEPGAYAVTLEVTDADWLTDTESVSVAVEETLDPDTIALHFNTTDAVFDPFRPYVYITDKYAQKTFSFPYMTESLAMTPAGDRLYVALLTREHDYFWFDDEGHIGYIASIDLATQVKDIEYMINEDPGDILVTSNEHLIVGSGSGQWTYIRVYEAADGTELSNENWLFRQNSRLALHPSETMVYAADVEVSPSDICRYDLKENGDISYAGDSPYHGDYRMYGNVWVSPLGNELVTRGGDVFTAGQPMESDMIYIASMTPVGSLISGICYDTATRIIFTGEGNSLRYYAMDNHLITGSVENSLPVNFVGIRGGVVAMLLGGTGTTYVKLIDHPLPGGLNNTYPEAALTATPTSGTTLTDFVFDGSSSHDDQDPLAELEFRWDLDGDGAWDTDYSSDPVKVWRYDIAGTYEVRLEVRDSLGWPDEAIATVDVVFALDYGSAGPTHDPFVLPYPVTDAAFDPVRPYMYVTSKYEHRVYFVNLETGLTERQFDFDLMTESLTITPDGSRLYAALLTREHDYYWFDGHVGQIACFDLSLGAKDGQFEIDEDPFDMVITSTGFLVVSSGSGQWDEIKVYDASDGTKLGTSWIRQLSRLSLHPSEQFVYAANTDTSPSDIERFDLSETGAITRAADSPYHGEYAMSGNVWANPLGDSLVVRGGHVFTAGMPIGEDMYYVTTMTTATVTSVAFDVADEAVFSIEGSMLRWYDIDTYAYIGSASTTVAMEFVGLDAGSIYCLDVQTAMTQISVIDNPLA